jgi:hypothetical protein
MTAIEPEQVALYCLSVNKNNGIYNPGAQSGIEEKLRVKASYQHFRKEANRGLRRNLTQVASDCNMSPPRHCWNVCQVHTIVNYASLY